MTENLTIGLYGIGGTYNYGCEAIVRGTEIILRDTYPDLEIVYASPRAEDDRKRLSGCKIKIVDRNYNSFFSFSKINSILSYNTGYYLNGFFNEDFSWADECDMIFSIGGDLYTLPDNHEMRRFPRYYNPLIHFGEIMMNLNKKFIVWGASIGPFEKDLIAKRIFVDHLSKANLITSREPMTSSYLRDVGITKNVVDFPDPAFVLKNPFFSEKEIKSKNDDIVIGLNLSPLSATQLDIDNEIEFGANIIRNLVKKFNADLILIPHVVSDFNVLDDDLRYLKSIYESLSEDIIEKVQLIEHDPGYLGIRDTLKSCDIIIASRMHCCINSISIGIPTIFLSYSKKSLGMSQYIYNDNEFVYPLDKITDESFFTLVKKIIFKKDDITNYLNRRLEEIQFNLNFLF